MPCFGARPKASIAYYTPCSRFLHPWPHFAGTVRYGEASHPGPSGECMLTVGVSNPSGLRQKEDILIGLGPGIWALSETQLCQQTLKTSSGILRRAAPKLNRHARFHSGAPAPLRQGSTWAGKWMGVATISDVPSMSLKVPWPLEHWNSGRVMLTRHWAAGTPITLGTIYGFAQGPTWPRARQMTDELLQTYTEGLVRGMAGDCGGLQPGTRNSFSATNLDEAWMEKCPDFGV